MNEWLKFLHRMNQTMSVTDAQLLFVHLDDNRSGTVEMFELLPIIFNKASQGQHKLMYKVCLSENSKRVKTEHEGLTKADVIHLFRLYSGNSGSLPVDGLAGSLESLGLVPRVAQMARIEAENLGLPSIQEGMVLEDGQRYLRALQSPFW
eukprot:FR742103.1.p1 GENE.FR742103.1~~FR742103.1.p1  ORF type:complete len:150 (+),score=16.77 FR742103.1:535-984(+)